MNKDENRSQTPVYADARSGPLAEHSLETATSQTPEPKKFRHIADHDSVHILMSFVFVCIGLTIAGLLIFVFNSYRASKATPKILSLALAKQITETTEFRAHEPYSALTEKINYAFASECKTSPVITLTFHYQNRKSGGSSDFATIDTKNIHDVGATLSGLADKVSQTTSTDFDISCPL